MHHPSVHAKVGQPNQRRQRKSKRMKDVLSANIKVTF